MRNSLKNRALRVVLVVTGVALMSCGTFSSFSSFSITNHCQIKGNYTATDFLDGNLKITSAEIYPSVIYLTFNNYRVLVLKPYMSSFAVKKKTDAQVFYRGHLWSKNKVSVTIDDVCADDGSTTFYVRFSANVNVKDCEKTILTFNCNQLHVQNDKEAQWVKFRREMAKQEKEKQEVKGKK